MTTSCTKIERIDCADCGGVWVRIVTRGRKPARCPKCAKPKPTKPRTVTKPKPAKPAEPAKPGRTFKPIECEDCGVMVEARSGMRRCCEPCAKARHRGHVRFNKATKRLRSQGFTIVAFAPCADCGLRFIAKQGRRRCLRCTGARDRGSVVRWCAANRERRAEYDAAHYAANRERVAGRQAAYWASPAGKAARHRARLKRQMLAEQHGTYVLSPKDQRRLVAAPCAACGSTENLHVDHIIPLSRGGAWSVGNLQMLCPSCNSSKNDLTMTEWRTSGRARARLVFGSR